MGVEPLVALPPRVLVAGRLHPGVGVAQQQLRCGDRNAIALWVRMQCDPGAWSGVPCLVTPSLLLLLQVLCVKGPALVHGFGLHGKASQHVCSSQIQKGARELHLGN